MFRRTDKAAPKGEAHTTAISERGSGAKGRPTPSRKEAEAAARQRAKTVVDKKAAARLQRERRGEQNARVREAMRSGDERYLPRRDKGPVKRFIRNFIDARLTVVEFLLPLLLVIWFLQFSRNDSLVRIGTVLWSTTILVVAVDTLWLLVRIRRAIRAEFPDESLKGTTTYTLMRVVQVRPLRQPKPQVKIGGKPR